MSLTVTLKVFSGRPNPVWTLPEEAATEFRERVARLATRARTTNLKPGGVMGGLGYRGFDVQTVGKAGSIYVHAGIIDPGGQNSTLLTENRELERWLFSTASEKLSGGVQEHVDRSLNTAMIQIPIIIKPPQSNCPTCQAQDAPVYNQAFWTIHLETEQENNCYNYANNRLTDSFAQPGRGTGQAFTENLTCAGVGSVQGGAESDGLVASANFSNPLAAGEGWYAALVLWPGNDFHWYRQDLSGCWSHKPGDSYPMISDNAHNPITDPKLADRGPYSVFCSYMITRCGVKIH